MYCNFLRTSFVLCLLYFTPVLSSSHRDVFERQILTGPTTLESVMTTQSPQGAIVQSCTIVLTPMIDNQGNEQVVEVEQCSPPLEGGGSATASATTQTISGSTVPISTGGALSAYSLTFVPSPTSISKQSAGSAVSKPQQTGTLAADNASPPPASTSAAPFTVPGRSLQVLPVGLGVFAGITGIAMIIVALVTYERTKYRRAFRQRKLAESGAAMGYSSMA